MTNSNSESLQKKLKGFISILCWILIALIIRWQVIEPRWIPSGSMLPTLQIQEKLLIEKITPKLNILTNKTIKRDSIVVFKPPRILVESGYKEKTALIKRVIGVPGDIIEIKNGNLIRNSEVVNEPWRNEPINYEMEAIKIPTGYFWVLGDNRNNSLDSHFWGPLPQKNVIGTAFFRYWPLKKIGPIRFPDSKDS